MTYQTERDTERVRTSEPMELSHESRLAGQRCQSSAGTVLNRLELDRKTNKRWRLKALA